MNDLLYFLLSKNFSSKPARPRIIELIQVNLPLPHARLPILLILKTDEEGVIQQLVDRLALISVSFQAPIHEVPEFSRPPTLDLWHILINDGCHKCFSLADVCVWRHACSQLIGKATVRPNVNCLRIVDALGDLGGDPVRCPLLRLALLLLIGKEASEAQVSDLDVTICRMQDII